MSDQRSLELAILDAVGRPDAVPRLPPALRALLAHRAHVHDLATLAEVRTAWESLRATSDAAATSRTPTVSPLPPVADVLALL